MGDARRTPWTPSAPAPPRMWRLWLVGLGWYLAVRGGSLRGACGGMVSCAAAEEGAGDLLGAEDGDDDMAGDERAEAAERVAAAAMRLTLRRRCRAECELAEADAMRRGERKLGGGGQVEGTGAASGTGGASSAKPCSAFNTVDGCARRPRCRFAHHCSVCGVGAEHAASSCPRRRDLHAVATGPTLR